MGKPTESKKLGLKRKVADIEADTFLTNKELKDRIKKLLTPEVEKLYQVFVYTVKP